MTESRCIPVVELARVRDLPADAPERVHAESCPRCRAALLAVAEFERADEALPAEAGAARAHARLDSVIESLTTAEPAVTAPVAAPRREGPGWLARLLTPPVYRFAAGFAVVAIVSAASWFASRGPAERLERGGTGTVAAATVHAADGGWLLRWPAVEGADAYDVVFLAVDLREVARVANVRETLLALKRGELPAGVAPGMPLLVEIDARSGGTILEVSAPAAIELE